MDSQMKQEEIMAQINKALMNDDMDTVIELAQKIPMPPEVAEALRIGFGPDALKSSGFNLTAAEEAYGPNWLS